MFDQHDQYHAEARSKAEMLNKFRIVLPWPTLYETLRTKLVRNAVALARFERFLKTPEVIYLDDSLFRQEAMDLALESSLRQRRPLSMVDCLIRLLIDDVNIADRLFGDLEHPGILSMSAGLTALRSSRSFE